MSWRKVPVPNVFNRRRSLAAIDSMADALRKLNGYNQAEALEALAFLLAMKQRGLSTSAANTIWEYVWKPNALPAVAKKAFEGLGGEDELDEADLLETVNRHPSREIKILAARLLADKRGGISDERGIVPSQFKSPNNQALLDAALTEKYAWEHDEVLSLEKIPPPMRSALKEVLLSPDSLPGEQGISPSAGIKLLLSWLLRAQPNKADGPALAGCMGRYGNDPHILAAWLDARKTFDLNANEKRQMAALSRQILSEYTKGIEPGTFPISHAAPVFASATMDEANFLAETIRSKDGYNPTVLDPGLNSNLILAAISNGEWKENARLVRALPGKDRSAPIALAIKHIIIQSGFDTLGAAKAIRDYASVSPNFLSELWQEMPDDRKHVMIEATGREMPTPQLRILAGSGYGEKMEATIARILKERGESLKVGPAPMSKEPEPKEM